MHSAHQAAASTTRAPTHSLTVLFSMEFHPFGIASAAHDLMKRITERARRTQTRPFMDARECARDQIMKMIAFSIF